MEKNDVRVKLLVKKFIEELQEYKAELVFNPWRDFDEKNDLDANCPNIRRTNLAKYLELRLNTKYIFIAEAIGYQGGHFSGIAMTSERILLGNHKTINPEVVLGKDFEYKRTSNPTNLNFKKTQRELGFNEPTDTIVWDTLAKHSLKAFEVVLWNIFPFHPFKNTDILTNRTPKLEELSIGVEYTRKLLELVSKLQKLNGEVKAPKIIAIGQKAAETLTKHGIKCQAVRHPANGGATKFKEQVKNIFEE